MKRRLRVSALVAASAAVMTAASAFAQDAELVVFDFPGLDDPAFFPAYIEAHGISPTFAFYGDEEEAFQKLRAGFKADIAHPCSQSIARWKDAELIKPMDASRIEAWDDLIADLRDMPGFHEDGKVYLAATDWGNTALAYRTDLVDEADVASLEVFANPKFRGKVAITDNVDDAYALGFLAVGVTDWTVATDAQFQAASDFLRRVHPNVRYYSLDGPTLAQAMASGEVTVAWTWNEVPVTMQAEGLPVAMKRDTAEGATTWVCGYSLLAGGEGNEDKAYDFINAVLDPATAEYLVTAWGYGHANQAGLDRVDQEVLAAMGYDNPARLRAKTLWQEPVPAELREKMIAEFEMIKVGF